MQADNYDELNKALGTMMGEASKLGYLVNMDTDLRLNKPQLDLTIDRERAAGLGASVTDIGTTLETFLGGRVVTNFKRGTKQYDCILQMKPLQFLSMGLLDQAYGFGHRRFSLVFNTRGRGCGFSGDRRVLQHDHLGV